MKAWVCGHKTREHGHGGAKCTDGMEHYEGSCPFVSFFSVTQKNNCKIRMWDIQEWVKETGECGKLPLGEQKIK